MTRPETSLSKLWVKSLERPIESRPREPAGVSVLHRHERIVIMGYIQTVFEAAGGNEGMCRLAYAWHKR